MAASLLPPELRSQRARIAGLTKASKYDGREATAKARESFFAGFENQVDPDGRLSPTERHRRAVALRRAHMAKLAYASAKARAGRKGSK